MDIVLTLVAVAILAGSSWALGTAALSRMAWPDLHLYERVALRLTAGLGLTSLVLSLVALTGWFSHATAVLGTLAAIGGIFVIRAAWRGSHASRTMTYDAIVPFWARATSIAVFVSAVLACLGAIAPVTDDDALAYVVPIARHIAETGAVRVWTDQARSMELAELARDFALLQLQPSGALLVKVFQGAGYDEYLKSLRAAFTKVVVRKPDASRDESAEQYLLARGLKAGK